jgi:heptosyltransferase-2
MCTPAIENIINSTNPKEVYFVGSFVSIELLKHHPKTSKIFIDKTKNSGNRYLNILKLAKDIGPCDIAITFRNSFTSALLLYMTKSHIRIGYKNGIRNLLLTNSFKKTYNIHQVQKYNHLVNSFLNTNTKPIDTKLYIKPFDTDKKLLGINAGATYGSAKRWYPKEFAKVAISQSKTHDILIFGSPNEQDICNDIENILKENNIKNYKNLAGQTSIEELVKYIGSLDIFVTNDSGPMHIASAFKINTFAIFGPTRYKETNQWNNPNETIIRKKLNCSPCMKRVCPLGHHDCMKLITAKDVIEKIENN